MKMNFSDIIAAEKQRDYDHPNPDLLAFATMLEVSKQVGEKRRKRRLSLLAISAIILAVCATQLLAFGSLDTSSATNKLSSFISTGISQHPHWVSLANFAILSTLLAALKAFKVFR